MAMSAVMINQDGKVTVAAHPDDESDQYQNVRKGIGCKFVERVRFSLDGHAIDMWVDEEGLMNSSLAYNSVASMLASSGGSNVFLVGNAVMTGPDFEGLTEDAVTAILESTSR